MDNIEQQKKKKNKLIHKCDSSLCDRTCIERNKIKITLHQMQQGSLGKKVFFFVQREQNIPIIRWYLQTNCF